MRMAMTYNDILAPDFSDKPYWWKSAPPQELPAVSLLPEYDVAIMGSGITGLRAAIDLARGGARVVVFESEQLGSGASRRNAGFLGRVLKKSFRDIEKKDGLAKAKAVYSELQAAFRSVIELVEREGIACHLAECGRFIAATSPAHQEILVAEMQALQQYMGQPFEVISRERVRDEMGSSNYFGGVVIPDLASLHPGLYHKGLGEIALKAGVTILTGCPVHSINRAQSGPRHRVVTTRGTVAAQDVIVATNGYTPRALKRYARRVIPFNGYLAVTEEISPNLLREIIPHGRTIIDSNTNIDFFRPAPDSARLMFGGDTGANMAPAGELAARMHAILVRTFPQMEGVRISNVWTGKCAGTFDMMPHLGCHDGVWHGMGYNFAGVPMGTYFGEKIAQQILHPSSEPSVFMNAPEATMPFYNGSPWFVPLAMRYFDWQDRRLGAR